MRRTLLSIGLLLLLVSAPVLVLMALEAFMGHYAYNRYELQPVYNSTQIRFNGHVVALKDSVDAQGLSEGDTVETVVTLHVDEQEHSFNTDILVRPLYSDMRRYAYQLSLVSLTDTKSGRNRVAVVSRSRSDQPIRILLIDSDGQVEEDLFSLSDRARPVYRTMLTRFVSPSPIGFYSNVLQGYPSLFYPLVYPFVSGAAGFMTLLILVATRRRQGQQSPTGDGLKAAPEE